MSKSIGVVDINKLTQAVKERGFSSLEEAAVAIGAFKRSLTNLGYKGKGIGESLLHKLNTIGIDYDMIKPDEKNFTARISNRIQPNDGPKLKALLKERGVTIEQAAIDLGYSLSQITGICARNSRGLSRPMMKALENRYGITYDMIAPDPEPEPEPEPADEPEPEPAAEEAPAQQEITVSGEVDIAQDLETALVPVLEAIEQAGKRAYLSEETIAQGVNWGLEIFWKQHKKEIMQDLKGAMFAAQFDAMKKHDEYLDERMPIRYDTPSKNPNFCEVTC